MNQILPTDRVTLDELNRQCRGTLAEALGIVFTAMTSDFLEARMPVDHRTKQPYGVLHGGASVALAETLGSVGSTLLLPEGDRCVGIEINANHLKSVENGEVTGRATPIRIGRRVHVWQIDIHDEDGKLICVSRLTVAILGGTDAAHGSKG